MQRQHLVLLLAFPLLILSLSISGHLTQSVGLAPETFAQQPSQNQAQQAINVAQTAINTAYTNLAFADAAGSSIMDLVATLNGAIIELNQARRAYNQTDYSTAISLAQGVETTANNVSDEAQLRGLTSISQTQGQIVLVFAVVLISLPASYMVVERWQKYRKQKKQEFLRMEIRLPDDEEEDDTK
jgi:hypothetical protein